MEEKEFIQYLRACLDQYPTIAAFCKEKKLSQAYVGDVLHGRRGPGKKIASALGFEQSVVYRPCKKNFV